jgi:hypothetical protein
LTTTEDFVCLQVHLNFNTNIHHQQRPGLTTHPRHQGNAQALCPLGRSLHRDGGHQSSDLPSLVGRRPRRPKCLEHRATMSLLPLEDLYQKKLCTLPFCNLYSIKKEIPYLATSLPTCFSISLLYSVFTLPPRNTQRLGFANLRVSRPEGVPHILCFQVRIVCLAFGLLMNVPKSLVRETWIP